VTRVPGDGSLAPSPARPRSSARAARWLLPAALLAAEYLALSLLVDLPLAGAAMPAVRAARVGMPVVLGTAAAGWLMARTGGAAGLGTPPASPLPPWRPWPALWVQPLAYLVTAVLAVRLFGPGAAAPGAFAVCGFLLGALLTALLAAAMAAPLPWLSRELVQRWREPLLALALGIAAWRAAAGAEELWGVLSGLTLRASAAILSLSEGPVSVDAARATIGLRGFEVQVAPVCSGADGLGLVLTFQLMWLAFSRRRLRVGRALWLLPLGLAAALAANAARIAGLVLLGAAGHSTLALGGFHSKAGWALFLTIALGSAALAGRLRWLRRPEASAAPDAGPARPEVASLVPLVFTLGAALLTGVFSAGALDRLYAVRIAVALGALAWVRRALPPLSPSRSVVPAALGLAVGLAWVAALRGAPRPLAQQLAALGGWERTAWIVVRGLGSVLVIPAVEELAFRGFLFEWLAPPGQGRSGGLRRAPWAPLAVSSLAFGAIHSHLALGVAAGLALGAVRAWRGRVGDALLAHAVANAVVATAAVLWARWDLWA